MSNNDPYSAEIRSIAPPRRNCCFLTQMMNSAPLTVGRKVKNGNEESNITHNSAYMPVRLRRADVHSNQRSGGNSCGKKMFKRCCAIDWLDSKRRYQSHPCPHHITTGQKSNSTVLPQIDRNSHAGKGSHATPPRPKRDDKLRDLD